MSIVSAHGAAVPNSAPVSKLTKSPSFGPVIVGVRPESAVSSPGRSRSVGPRPVSGRRGRCGVQVERWQQRPDQLPEPIAQPILDGIDRLNHNVDDPDAVRTDRDRRVRSLGSARVAGIDVAIRTVERTAGVEIDHAVEIDHGNEIDDGYGIEPGERLSRPRGSGGRHAE